MNIRRVILSATMATVLAVGACNQVIAEKDAKFLDAIAFILYGSEEGQSILKEKPDMPNFSRSLGHNYVEYSYVDENSKFNSSDAKPEDNRDSKFFKEKIRLTKLEHCIARVDRIFSPSKGESNKEFQEEKSFYISKLDLRKYTSFEIKPTKHSGWISADVRIEGKDAYCETEAKNDNECISKDTSLLLDLPIGKDSLEAAISLIERKQKAIEFVKKEYCKGADY